MLASIVSNCSGLTSFSEDFGVPWSFFFSVCGGLGLNAIAIGSGSFGACAAAGVGTLGVLGGRDSEGAFGITGEAGKGAGIIDSALPFASSAAEKRKVDRVCEEW